MQNVQINSLLEWADTEGKKHVERLIWILPTGPDFLVIPVIGTRAWPSVRSKSELEDMKRIEVVDCPPDIQKHLEILPEARLTEKMIECRNRAWDAIRGLVRDPIWAINAKQCGTVIREHAKTLASGVNRTTLYKYLRRFWQRGQILDALQPDLRLCGRPGGQHEPSWLFAPADFEAPGVLARRLKAGQDLVSQFVWAQFSDSAKEVLIQPAPKAEKIRATLAREFNKILRLGPIFDEKRFETVRLTQEALELKSLDPTDRELIHLNRLLLQIVYANEIAAVPQSSHLFSRADFNNLSSLVARLPYLDDSVSRFLWERIRDPSKSLLLSPAATDKKKERVLVRELNKIIRGDLIYDPQRFHKVELTPEIKVLLAQDSERQKTTLLNRLLLQQAYGSSIKPSRKGLLVDGKPKGVVPERKLGRPRLYAKEVGINIGAVDEGWFEEAIENLYKKGGLPLETAYEHMLRKRYSLPRENGDGSQVFQIKPKEQLPTFTQFKYFLESEYNKEDLLKNRVGELTFARKHRAILGDQTKQALAPGALYQIDSTVGDVYLVHSYDRRVPIGRPTIYLVVDTFSQMVVGVHIGVQSASYNVATSALWNTYRDKVKFCAENGIIIKPEQWPVHGLPQAVLADRGELLSNLSDGLVRLGVSVANTAPYRAEMKGIIERYLGLLNQRVIDFLPGAVDDSEDPSKPDYRKKAELNLYDFTRLVLLCILDYNLTSHSDYELTRDMMNAGIDPVPLQIWNWGIQNLIGMQRHVDANYVRTGLLPAVEASITGQGISIEGLKYSCPEGLEEGWFSNARREGAPRVMCHYDPDDVGEIYLLHDRKIITCELTDRSALGHEKLSWAEYRNWKKVQHERKEAAQHGEQQRRANVSTQSEAIRQKAKDERGKGPLDKDIEGGKRSEQEVQRLKRLEQKAATMGLREQQISEPAITVSEHDTTACGILEAMNPEDITSKETDKK